MEEKYEQNSSLLLASVDLKFSSSNLSLTFAAILSVFAIHASVISGYDKV